MWPFSGVLDGVVHQVPDALQQQRRVTFDLDRAAGFHEERLLLFLAEHAEALRCVRRDGAEIDDLARELSIRCTVPVWLR
jgi:hypothetical protein